MKQIFLAACLLVSIGAFAQIRPTSSVEEVNKEVNLVKLELQLLQSETKKLRDETLSLQTQLKATHQTIDSLKQVTQRNSQVIGETAEQLGVKISTTEAAANAQFLQVNKSVSNTVLYIIIVLLLTLLASGIIYWFLTKRQKTDKSEVINQLDETKKEIEEQLKKIEEITEKICDVIAQTAELEAGDHELAKKLAGEINTMERNLSLMSEDVKGLKQLKRSIDTLKDNLSAKGYDVPKLLGKEFRRGMKVSVINSNYDETLEKGAEIITKVIVPQVNYNGKMIQAAQIEITVGPELEEVPVEAAKAEQPTEAPTTETIVETLAENKDENQE